MWAGGWVVGLGGQVGGLAGWRVGMRQGIPFRQGMRVGGLESWDRGSAAALFSLDGADPISADPIWPILPENSRLYFWRPARQVLPCSPSPPLPLQKQLAEGAGGSMYVSGLPGTGGRAGGALFCTAMAWDPGFLWDLLVLLLAAPSFSRQRPDACRPAHDPYKPCVCP